MDALFGRAAGLRRVELIEPRNVIGRTTVESVQSGVIYGYAALVDGMVNRITSVVGTATVIATGSLADFFTHHCSTIDHVEPWVTLHGLRLIWERNTAR